MQKLLPCPFCWSPAELRTKQPNDFNYLIYPAYDIACSKPNCYLTDGAEYLFDTPEEAAKLWNRRRFKEV